MINPNQNRPGMPVQPSDDGNRWTSELMSRERLRVIEEAHRMTESGRLQEAADLWCQCGEYEQAAPLLEKLGLLERAAASFKLAGEHNRAGALYEKAGELEEAALAYIEVGNFEAVSRLRAHMLVKLGEHERAAELFAAGQDFALAATHYRKAGKNVKAAKMYARGGRPELAARILVDLNRLGDAAKCFERAEDWRRAAACWAKVNKKRDVARCLGSMGQPYDAGCVCLEAGWTEDAIAWFEAVAPLCEPFARAAEKLAQLYEKVGRLTDAARAMGDALEHVQPTEENLGTFELWIKLLERGGDWNRIKDVAGLLVNAGLASPEIARRAAGPRPLQLRPEPCRSASTEGFDASAPPVPVSSGLTMGAEPLAPAAEWALTQGDWSPPPSDHGGGGGGWMRPGRVGRRRQTRNRYHVGRLIGRGGRGEVYEAYDNALRRSVALKRVRPDLAGSPEARKALQDEASLAARLDHKNIVKVYDIELTAPVQLALELVNGRTLGEIMNEHGGRIPMPEFMKLLEQLCNALDYAHGRQVIHRDLKPSNIMVTFDGTVKLLDFGIARLIDTSNRRVREIAGTPYYMSPEQCALEPLDPRSDVYSLGCVVFEALVGRAPFTDGDVLRHHIATTPPNAEDRVKGLPIGVGSVIQRAMAKSPHDRFRTAGLMYKALKALQ